MLELFWLGREGSCPAGVLFGTWPAAGVPLTVLPFILLAASAAEAAA